MKKVFLVFLIAFMLLFILINNIYASFVFSAPDGVTYYEIPEIDIPEGYFYFVIDISGAGSDVWYQVYAFPFECVPGKTNRMPDGSNFTYYTWRIRNGVFKDSTSSTVSSVFVDANLKVFYSNYDVYNAGGKLLNKANAPIFDFVLNLEVVPSENTTVLPVIIQSQLIPWNSYVDYDLKYSLDKKEYKDCPVRSLSGFEDGSLVGMQYYLEVYRNGMYYFKLTNKKTGEEIEEEVEIDNIVYTQDNINNYINGVFKPTPFLNYEYVSDTEILLTTQKFTLEELGQLECSYCKYIEGSSEEYSSEDVNVRAFTNEDTGETKYQFYINISNAEGNGDGTYFVRFYIKNLDEYSSASASVFFDEIVEHHKQTTFANLQFQKFIDFFKERFGFLSYPFELIVDVLHRINRIQFVEPKINIPDIYEPVTHEKIVAATEFNFNDLLKNDTLKNVHEIYLIVVDAILIFGIAMFAKNQIFKVLSK